MPEQNERPVLTEEEQRALIEDFDGAVGDELQTESPFLAEIMADEIIPGKWAPQWHVAVKPLQFALRGKTGMFHEYYGLSKQARSKMGAALISIAEHKIIAKGTQVGKGYLIGTVAWFVRRDMKFGKSASGEQLVSEGVLLVYSKASEEEQDLAGTAPTSTVTTTTTAPPPAC